MTSLERAKAFAQSSARLALTIVPLAVATAGAAHGIAIFPPSFTVTSASCPGGSVSNLAINNSTGIKLYTGTSCSAGFSGGGSLTLSASGTGSGTIPFSGIPINVIFTPTFDGGGNIDYSFVLNLNGSTNPPQLFGNAVSGTQVSQGFNFPVGSGVTLSSWSVALTISTLSGLGTLGLTVPQNSIDINAAAAPTPEPSSLLLFSSAAGLLLMRRRKR